MKKLQTYLEDNVIHQKDKTVDNETFKKYLSNKDYWLIMQSASKQFHNYIPADDLKSCQLVGLFHAIRKHNGMTKFTTYLHNYVRWECLTYMKKHMRPEHSLDVDVVAPEKKGLPFDELVDHLPELEQSVVRQYFVEQKTFAEIGDTIGKSHETARKYYNRAMDRLKKHFARFPINTK